MAEGGRQEGSLGCGVGAQVPMATPGPTRGPEAAGPGKDAPPGEAEAGQRTWTLGEAKSVLSTQILGCEPPASRVG